MNKKIILLVIIMILSISVFVLSAQASITNVSIQPVSPIFNDDISLVISGMESSGAVLINDSVFVVNDFALELTLDMFVGGYTVMSQWSHTEDIGKLSIGTYDLTVNMSVDLNPSLNDTFTTSFEVVPEPSSLLLLSLGGVLLRTRKP